MKHTSVHNILKKHEVKHFENKKKTNDKNKNIRIIYKNIIIHTYNNYDIYKYINNNNNNHLFTGQSKKKDSKFSGLVW